MSQFQRLEEEAESRGLEYGEEDAAGFEALDTVGVDIVDTPGGTSVVEIGSAAYMLLTSCTQTAHH